MSRLYIDITELANWQGKLTGVPRVIDEVAKRFHKHQENVVFVKWAPGGYSLSTYDSTNHESSEETVAVSPENLTKRAARKVYRKSRIARKAVNIARQKTGSAKNISVSALELHKGDVLFVLAEWHGGDPSFVEFLKAAKNKGVKLVQMTHDMLPIVTPQYSGHSTEMLKNYSTQVYPLCDLIFSNSEHTKKDVIGWLSKNKLFVPQIDVIRLGDDFSNVTSRKPKIDFPEEYLLCVGTIEARKNHTLLYYAYKLAEQKKIKLPKIVVVGRLGWLAEDMYKIITTDPETKDSFIFLHGINDNELAWLYKNCLFTVYPSFYEGWGLPIAESISHGKTVIASNTSSMPEIAGDLISYFNPSSSSECLERIKYLMVKDNLAEATKKIEKYSPYSWDSTYDIIYKAIKGL